MHKFFQLQSYFHYWLNQVDKHSLHSPFFYEFYTKVVHPNQATYYPDRIEALRKSLLANSTSIEVADMGAISVLREKVNKSRAIHDIAATSLSPQKFSKLYARIITHFKLKNIIELGTSFGINTLYLAANPGVEVTTFEGLPAIARMANTNFEFADARNIKLIEGDINETLPSFLQHEKKWDFVFMDANHRFEPTLKYFNALLTRVNTGSILVLDDIHYTAEMEKAWQMIRTHPLVYGSLDLFRAGIVFFDPSLNKQHAVIRF